MNMQQQSNANPFRRPRPTASNYQKSLSSRSPVSKPYVSPNQMQPSRRSHQLRAQGGGQNNAAVSYRAFDPMAASYVQDESRYPPARTNPRTSSRSSPQSTTNYAQPDSRYPSLPPSAKPSPTSPRSPPHNGSRSPPHAPPHSRAAPRSPPRPSRPTPANYTQDGRRYQARANPSPVPVRYSRPITANHIQDGSRYRETPANINARPPPVQNHHNQSSLRMRMQGERPDRQAMPSQARQYDGPHSRNEQAPVQRQSDRARDNTKPLNLYDFESAANPNGEDDSEQPWWRRIQNHSGRKERRKAIETRRKSVANVSENEFDDFVQHTGGVFDERAMTYFGLRDGRGDDDDCI